MGVYCSPGTLFGHLCAHFFLPACVYSSSRIFFLDAALCSCTLAVGQHIYASYLPRCWRALTRRVLSDSLGVALLHAVTGGRSRREMLKMCMMMLLFVLEHSDQLWQVVQSRTYNTLFLLDLIWR
jgi:hypothetical protein